MSVTELAARVAHEANRAYCLSIGDDSQPAWEDAPDWQRKSALAGVEGVIAGNGPEQSHASWLAQKRVDGWIYGEVKDPEARTHPCMVSYDELPAAQKRKDAMFVGVVQAVVAAMA